MRNILKVLVVVLVAQSILLGTATSDNVITDQKTPVKTDIRGLGLAPMWHEFNLTYFEDVFLLNVPKK